MPFEDTPLPADFQVKPLVPLKYGRGNPPRKKKGQVAKVTRDVKQGILEGAISHGSDGEGTGGLAGYFQMCAAKYPKHYMGLLGKLVPLNVNNTGTGASPTVINIVGVESGTFINEHGEQYQPPEEEPLEIEQLPEPAPPMSALEAKLLELKPQELLALAKALGMSEEPDPDLGWNTRRR